MMKLMKYELLRRKTLLIGTALAILLAEGIVILSLYLGDGWNILAFFLTVLMGVCGILLPILDAISRLFSDYKRKHGYMLFMIPQSGYRIIWSKIIFAVLEIVAAAVLIGGCFALSGVMVNHMHNDVLSQFIATIQAGGSLIAYGGLLMLQLLTHLSIAVLAVTVGRVLLKGKSYNWLLSLLLYFALATGVNLLNSGVLLAFGQVGDIMQLTQDVIGNVEGVIAKYFSIGAVTYVLWFFGCTTLAGRLVNRGIDL